jgi:hypothetical protein
LIARWPLREQEIVLHTPKDHFDYENLLAAVAKMTEVVTDVNENKRKVENVQKLLEIQNTIVSDTGAVGVLKSLSFLAFCLVTCSPIRRL